MLPPSFDETPREAWARNYQQLNQFYGGNSPEDGCCAPDKSKIIMDKHILETPRNLCVCFSDVVDPEIVCIEDGE